MGRRRFKFLSNFQQLSTHTATCDGGAGVHPLACGGCLALRGGGKMAGNSDDALMQACRQDIQTFLLDLLFV
jgi:hypothetical protein